MFENADLHTRRSERKPLRKAVILMIESGGEATSHPATTVNASEHGLRVKAHTALVPGQLLDIVQPDEPADPLRCLVVWAADISSDGMEEAGLEFLQAQSKLQES
jgi:PilZ domain